MSVTSKTHSTQLQEIASDSTWLRQRAEKLFEATDATAVLTVCGQMLADLNVHGRLHWRDADAAPTDLPATQLRLVEDVATHRVLMFDADDVALSAQARDELLWVGR
ncbi:MAG TPA: bifunctional diguanylate cyclase/phosphodiesterase, partial [Rhodanobacter sp.]|nr:bifunctional diguanylate cyclase/phosphodiesterase [Rhodanobacter sp.]